LPSGYGSNPAPPPGDTGGGCLVYKPPAPATPVRREAVAPPGWGSVNQSALLVNGDSVKGR